MRNLSLGYINKQINMNAIQPTEAELKWIQLQREKEAIEKKEAEAKKAIQLEKDIKDAEARIIKILDKDSEQLAAALDYHTALSKITDNYKIDYILKDETIVVKGDYINPDNPKENNYDRIVSWSKTIKRRSAVINYFNSINNTNYAVFIREHMTYGYRAVNQGYKMYISGPGIEYKTSNRAYKNPAKVNEIITETIESINRKVRIEEKKKNVLVDTVTKMKELYPDAQITEGYDYERDYKNNIRYPSERYDTITIRFTNGINIKYKLYSDGSLGRLRVGFNTNDEWSLMEVLNNIPIIKPVS